MNMSQGTTAVRLLVAAAGVASARAFGNGHVGSAPRRLTQRSAEVEFLTASGSGEYAAPEEEIMR